jgi:hypothetical protein
MVTQLFIVPWLGDPLPENLLAIFSIRMNARRNNISLMWQALLYSIG